MNRQQLLILGLVGAGVAYLISRQQQIGLPAFWPGTTALPDAWGQGDDTTYTPPAANAVYPPQIEPQPSFLDYLFGESAATPAHEPVDVWDVQGEAQAPQTAPSSMSYNNPASGLATRGERTNNPGNLEKGQPWQGLAADQSGDVRFATFQTPEYGIRALAVLLKGYVQRGFNTIRKIINRYAPAVENKTNAYIKHVASLTGIHPDQVLTLNGNTLASLVAAIITHENGRNIYSAETIEAGVGMA